MKIQNVKGGYDFLPEEQKIRNYINNIIIKNFKEYGFNSIETPILCYYNILADKYDENNDLLKEIYRLSDQGKRELGLRYDLTVPFAKFIALNKNKITFPFKRYEIAKVFRDGPIKMGRDREFIQCDADVVGIEGQFIEAELLSLYVKIFNELNIDIYIKYNSRNLTNGLILESGISENLLSKVTTIIDKKDKISSEKFINYLKGLKIEDSKITILNNLLKMSLDEINVTFKNTSNKSILKGLEEVSELTSILKKLGLNDICRFDITLARGQNYYTGNIFEVYDKEKRISGSIAAGGRYDKMIGNFINDGKEYPCVGISFGLSAIYEIVKQKNISTESDTNIYIIPIGTEIESIKIANILRNNGYNVEVEMNKRKLSKSLDYANRQKIKYVMVIGLNEIETGNLNIKSMKDGNTRIINIDEIENFVF